ncbi:unnamed protein product (macronuclear) [Paramecium tetraurelia]|uniref:Uncharacterized protein n=1 Tax=Paramecium tetraurelia TaxID=5888 RepID=A0BAU7_PARTE|nr:uncharacterized protein GSPATT00000099001 [Paramecium tetraurelia]CAK55664.1 unnamed protein product [Paramecium tetraurelia]|eukprot:XP_001423062.1 hypothetical protein (macronuclear) [Paramecium tetraurelia strain d4-2]
MSLHLLVKDSGFDMFHSKRIIYNVRVKFQILELNDEQLTLDTINYFIYSLIRVSDESQLVFNFVELNKLQKTINYIIYFYTDQSIVKKILPINIFNFEGVWIFFYFYNHYDVNHILFYYYQSNLDQLYQETLDSTIKVKNTDQLQSSIRYFKNIQILESNIITYPFLGIIKQVETTSINILEDLNSFKQTCNVELICTQIKTQLLHFNQSFTGGQSTDGQTDNIFQNAYKFSGWVKQNPIDIEIKLDSALLSISIDWINSQNQQQQYQLLKVLYNQHKVRSLNGFSASTYSYSFPYVLSSDQIETFKILDDSLQDLLTQWHFIQYEEGSSLNQGRPIYRVYFPQNDKFIECKWSNQINHFSDVILKFQIGGDYLSLYNFRGYLSDWKFSYYCQRNYESSYEIPCHYTCSSCKGITANDCLSCNENLNRIYSPNTNQCLCLDGYLETFSTAECKSLSDYNGVFEVKYFEVSCDTVGYYQCDESKVQCDFGYFQYYGSCIEWYIYYFIMSPHFSVDIKDYKLDCALCYLSPWIFNQTFMCDFDLIADNSESPFYYFERYYSNTEIYKINFNNRYEFSYQVVGGKYMQQNQTFCKAGYFLQQGECRQCIEGCEFCKSEYFCVQCSSKYALTAEGICKLCTKCELCYFDDRNEELCQYDFYCLDQQYYLNNLCIDCGQFCQQCDSEQCFYCIENKKYYVSLDGINCGYCSIENCEYCIEYVYDNDNNLIVSIDVNRDNIQSDMYQIHLGCAQCVKGYYYSFQTQKCQLLADDMAECDVGLSLDVNQGIVCLKSQSLSDSIQSTFCQDTKLCLQCINNYSSTLPSFCIVCKEGYYSSILTGLCKQCPQSCKACAQQSSKYKDYWKWEIKAFYSYFINQNGQHPFETYVVDSDDSEQEINCLSCQVNYVLFNNFCILGCDDDCEDCRVMVDAFQQYQSRCFKCKSNVFNKLRSYKFENQLQIDSQCETCPNYCSACYPRTQTEISQINLFFNQTSQYLKYSFKCYYVDQNQNYKYILPETLSLQNCRDFQKCTKTLEIKFKVYNNLGQLLDARAEETNINLLEMYQYLLDITLYNMWQQYETPELLEYYNSQNIEEISINYQLESSQLYLDFGSTLQNNLKQNVFNLKRVNVKMFALNKYVLYSTFNYFRVINYDQIIFEDFDFKSPSPYYATIEKNITLRFEITNKHYPQIVIFKNVNFVQTDQNNTLDFTLKCNRSKYFSMIDMKFNLNLTDSIFFQYYPFISKEVSKMTVQNFRVFNNFLYNSTLFYYFAENNTFNCVISFINVTIQNTLFTRNSSFITSNFQKDYDIGIIQLENFTLIDVIFENSSSFIRILSGKQISVKNFKLTNVKFLDLSSFLIGNTFSIIGFDVVACYLEFGHIITNIGKFSESKQVRESSEVLYLENINFTNNKYVQEKAFIYILQNQVSNISITVNNLYLFNNQQFYVQVGKLSYSFVSSDLSQLYFECSYCTFENLNITRGLGYPELTIRNSKHVELKKFTLLQNPQFELKSLHTSINCIRQFYLFDLPFVLSIKSFLKVYIDDVNISDQVIIDYPYFIFEGQNLNDQVEPGFITITNSQFANNMLIITQLNRLSSIISFQTYQDTKILIQNSTFQGNFLNKYEDDTQLHSSSTIIIDSQIGQVIIQDCLFQQNTVSNSSDSNIYIKSETLVVQNCMFINQNQLSHQLLQKHLLIPIDQTNYNDIVNEIFYIMSQGGSGYFFINELTMIQCVINNSLAVNGGAFYINTKSTGKIIISNSSFENTLTILNSNQFSSGGVLYIDASKSRLNLAITETKINRAYSRTQGGAIYIEASRIQNEIILQDVSIANSFSFKSSILFFSPNQSIFQSTEQEFNIYLSQIEDLSIQDILPFQKENPAIYISYSNFTIVNSSFPEIHLINLIEIYNGININILNVEILNSTIFASQIIRVALRQDVKARLVINNLIIKSLTIYQFNKQECISEIQNINNQLLCPTEFKNILLNPSVQTKLKNNTNQLNCNLNLVQTYFVNNFSLIELNSFQELHEVQLDNIELNSCHCKNCYFGLISIQEFDFSSLKLKIKKMKVLNNTCGTLGCLSIFQSQSNDIVNENNRLLKAQNLVEIEYSPLYDIQMKIEDSQFLYNKALYGGACYIQSVNLLVDNCQILSNEAQYKGGGIFYSSNNTQITVINSLIINNTADIAGGIYMSNDQMAQPKVMNLQMKNNIAHYYGDNVVEYPKQLKLKFNSHIILQNKIAFKNASSLIEESEIVPYSIFGQESKTSTLLLPSGIRISKYKYFDFTTQTYEDYNLTFRILAINSFGEQITNLSNSFCSIYAQEIQNTEEVLFSKLQFDPEQSKQYLSITKIEFNLTTGDFNLDDLIIYFNPQTDNKISLLLAIACDQIQVFQFNEVFPYEKTSVISDYYVLVQLRTFKCQLGEYLNSTSGGCVECDITQNQFSVTIDALKCEFRDEVKMKSLQPAMIELREGYWRAYYYSNIIEECYHLRVNCEGGWHTGEQSCFRGHIGALCEQCDLYNIQGDGSFSLYQQYQCSSCEDMAANIATIGFVLIWTLLSVFLSVNSTIKLIEEFTYYTKLKTIVKHIIFSSSQTSVLLKVFTNYLQIISSISTFQLSIPAGIQLTFRSVGNPIESMSFSLDCYLAQMTIIPILYFRIIWAFVMVGIYILIFIGMHLLLLIFDKKKKMSITFITTTFIYIYIYLSPNIISGLVALLSYRNISNVLWITGNVAYGYNTEQHYKWLSFFIIPSFIIVGFLMPLFFWYVVYHNRAHLNTSKVRKIWGYLYNEYKVDIYYWETIKILQKEFIIYVLIYYEDYVPVKSSLIFFVLLVYGYLTNHYKPYEAGDLNSIDSLQTAICKVSIILSQTIYTSQSLGIQEIVIPAYFLLAILNFFFIVRVISKILFAYFERLSEQVDKVKQYIVFKFPYIVQNNNKYCLRLFRNSKERKQVIRNRFKLIKMYLIQHAKFIISYKQYQQQQLKQAQQSRCRGEQDYL